MKELKDKDGKKTSGIKNKINIHIEERFRSTSAPPVDKFFLEDDIELGDIQNDLNYSSYYRRNCKNEPRLKPPTFFMRGQNSLWASQHDDIIAKAFLSTNNFSSRSTKEITEINRSLIERIDEDYPESEKSSEYKGTSRTTTPIGNTTVIDTEIFNIMLNLKAKCTIDTVPVPKKPVVVIDEILENDDDNMFYRDLLVFNNDKDEKKTKECITIDTKELCVNISKDQEGSRWIQKRLESSTPEEISWFFEAILDSSADLSSNLFGNYVIQKIIPLVDQEERIKLISKLKGQIHNLSVHPYGCRVIQRLIDCSQDIDFIFDEIKSDMLSLIEDQNGNHVIQRCIEKSKDRKIFLNHFVDNSLTLSTHKYGCRVIQRMLEFCSEKEIREIVALLIKNIEGLVNDQYGNYVIQHVLSIGGQNEKNEVINKIIENSIELSKYKFSSNVIEQCVKISNLQQKKKFLDKFLELDGERPNIFHMCTDMYGNYVVQRFYNSCDDSMQKTIQKVLKPYVKDLKKTPFARQIIFKITV